MFFFQDTLLIIAEAEEEAIEMVSTKVVFIDGSESLHLVAKALDGHGYSRKIGSAHVGSILIIYDVKATG
jgi:hypothetical protein